MKRLLMLAAALALAWTPAGAQTLTKLKAGMVTGIDQIGLPIALERGFFEKNGLDVTIARPYATGVDALNALQAGESEIVQVGVPMIGAVLRGMDLVALGNYSGNATKAGSDATVAIVAREGSGIVKGDLATLRGKKIAASFGTINHLYILATLEKAGLKPEDVTLVNTPPPDMTVALLAKGIDAFSGWDPWPIVAGKDVPGAFEVIRGGDVISYIGFNVALGPGCRPMARPSRNSSPPSPKPINGCARIRSWPLRLRHGGYPGSSSKSPKRPCSSISSRRIADCRRTIIARLFSAEDRLAKLGILKSTFDVNAHIEPKYILKVMKDKSGAVFRPAADS